MRLIASAQSWIDDEAVRQLYAVAALDGVRQVIGFPDLQPGKSIPGGIACVTDDIIHPRLLGGDIGCGMAWFKTGLEQRDTARINRWLALPFQLEHPWDEDLRGFLTSHDLEPTEFDTELGTLGGGNHFAELQAVEEIVNAREFRKLRLSRNQLVVLVHSGSRSLGNTIQNQYLGEFFGVGLQAGSNAAAAYLDRHDFALRWAKASRQLVARRFATTLGTEVQCLWDGCHNSITPCRGKSGTVWVHRRGAVAADSGLVVIPGSCGSLSYVVKPLGNDESRAWSLAHGAGRKWARSEARLRMRERFGGRQLLQTPLGGRVICEERDLLYEEAPVVYKNIESVITDLAEAGLASVVATLRPVLTYKTRKLKR